MGHPPEDAFTVNAESLTPGYQQLCPRLFCIAGVRPKKPK